jgi:hypothetical protein
VGQDRPDCVRVTQKIGCQGTRQNLDHRLTIQKNQSASSFREGFDSARWSIRVRQKLKRLRLVRHTRPVEEYFKLIL